jgi:hypothetical protein
MQAISRVIHRFFAARLGTAGPIFATPVLMLTAIARGSAAPLLHSIKCFLKQFQAARVADSWLRRVIR